MLEFRRKTVKSIELTDVAENNQAVFYITFAFRDQQKCSSW